MKKGFTLAELLIALAIVGAIAVMSVPTLVSSYRQHVASVRLKKFYLNMKTAIQMSEIKNGRAVNWSKEATVYDDKGKQNNEENNRIGDTFFDTYLAPYLRYKYKKYEKGNTAYYFNDGSSFYLWNGACLDIIYDTNGAVDRPNQEGKDRFRFLICLDDNQRKGWHGNSNAVFSTYGPGKAESRAKALSLCKQKPAYCSTLLLYDGWVFKKDYPY